jgi:hypothetical protein
MIQMLALQIDQTTYPIAAGFLGGGFLAVPEKDTYGGIVVINQIIAPTVRPVGARNPRIMYSGGGRRYRDERSITFENTWFERETFDAEFNVEGTTGGVISFWEIARKPEAEIQEYYSKKTKELGGHQAECRCGGECDYCHGEDD